MASGEKAIPAEHCKTIESLSGGEVTCPEMRPLDWHKYWPELATPHHADAPADQTARQAHPIEHRSQSARRDEEGATHLRRKSTEMDCQPPTPPGGAPCLIRVSPSAAR